MINFVQQNNRSEHRKCPQGEKNHMSQKSRRRKLDQTQLRALLGMYSDSDYTTAEIARRFGVSEASVTHAAKGAGVLLRGRGSKRQKVPPPPVQAILLEAWTDKYENVAIRSGVTKQRIAKIVGRWRNWALAQFGPRESCARNQRVRKSEPSQPDPFAAGPHVISFRIPGLVFTALRERSAKQCPQASPHATARSLILQQLGFIH
jgi:hypothetical protein